MATTELYLIRHGDIERNPNPEVIPGPRAEAGLTELGVRQAQTIGIFLMDQAIVPEVVYTSPVKRNLQMAAYSLAQMGLADLSVYPSDALLGIDDGEWIGKERELVYTPDIKAKMERDGLYFRPPGGESMIDVGQRVFAWIEHLTEKAASTPTRIFAYTHGFTVRCLMARLSNLSYQDANRLSIPNASVSLIVGSKKDAWQPTYIGRTVPADNVTFNGR